MKLTEKEVLDILKNEVDWCSNNPDESLSPDFQRGFVAGLEQAQLLIEKAEKARWNVDYRLSLGRLPKQFPYTTTAT